MSSQQQTTIKQGRWTLDLNPNDDVPLWELRFLGQLIAVPNGSAKYLRQAALDLMKIAGETAKLGL